MAELEDDLAALAPRPDTQAALVTLRARRRRRRGARLVFAGALSVVAVVAAGVLWPAPTVDRELSPAQVGEVDDRLTSSHQQCELEVAGYVGFAGPNGVALANSGREVCEVSQVSARGQSGDGEWTDIPAAPWEDRAASNLTLPRLLDPGDSFTVIVHNRSVPCLSADDGYTDFELRVDDQRFDPVAHDGVWPVCGIAMALLDFKAPESNGPSPLLWTQLTQEDAVVGNGTIAAATSPQELAELWRTHELEAPLPEVDFADAAAVAVTIGNRGCPPQLTGFERTDGAVFTPIFLDWPGECVPLDMATTYVAMLGRRMVGDAFVVRLPAQDPHYGEQRHSVVLEGGAPLCELELSLAVAGTELIFGPTLEAPTLNDAFAVSFVNVSADPCLIVDATASGENSAAETLALPQFSVDPVDGLELPATIDPGRGFRAVFAHTISPGLCDAPPDAEIRSTELMIGDRVVDISPGLHEGLVFPCGGFFRLEPTDPLEGVRPDLLDPRFQTCLLSFPAQCDDPFIRPA